jgi:hypothetical protein
MYSKTSNIFSNPMHAFALHVANVAGLGWLTNETLLATTTDEPRLRSNRSGQRRESWL